MYRLLMVVLILLTVSLVACDNDSPVEASEETLPPDPGEEGKITLEGIDSDEDGVRDDVEIQISFLTKDERVKAQLMVYARAKLYALNHSDDRQIVREQFDIINNTLNCLSSYEGSNAFKIAKEVRNTIVNTKLRMIANNQANSQVSGQSFSTPNRLGGSC